MSGARDLRRHARLVQAEAAAAAPGGRAVAVFEGTFTDFMDRAGLVGPSWAAWRAHWKAVDALPMTEVELALFRRCTGRQTPPAAPVPEVWDICGRRSGKTRGGSARAFYEGVRRDYRAVLAPGERAVIPVIAADKKQAGQALDYIKGLAKLAAFAPFVARTLKEKIELRTGAAVEVFSGSFRLTRGYTIACCVGDELAFWRSEDSAEPDREILTAVRPGMATLPGALLVAISTPYARRGEVWRAYDEHYGRDGDPVLVWNADSATMNSSLAAAVVERAYADDSVTAAAEWGAEFRRDVEALFSLEAVRACVVAGVRERPPIEGVRYFGFVDMSGGSLDSAALAITHHEEGQAVLDLVREVKAPHVPDQVVQQFVADVKRYRVHEVVGDRYSAEWSRTAYERAGVSYRASESTKSELYVALLPRLNSRQVALLDWPVLVAQLCGLERRVGRGTGRDSVDHQPNARDDVANAVAGAAQLAAAGGGSGRLFISFGGRAVEIDPEPPARVWSQHCGREMRRGPREDLDGDWLTCTVCGAARSLEPQPAGPDPTRAWGEL